MQGMGHEIYRTKLSKFFNGKLFVFIINFNIIKLLQVIIGYYF